MTFGQLKSIFETYLINSYKDKNLFKESLQDFKQGILNDKNLSKIYSLYNDLSTPQGLNEQDANDYLNDGLSLIQKNLKKVKLPLMESSKKISNKYEDIDYLVYSEGKNIDLKKRLECRKSIISILKESKVEPKKSVNIPINTMVTIANKKIKEYVDTLDESSKKEVYNILSENKEGLKTEFEILKTNSIQKLESLLESQGKESKNTITETIQKIKSEKFNHINFYKLKKLSETL